MPYKILIADDDTDFLGVLESKLSARYTVFTASDGITALEKLRTEKPDILISDILMPGMTGYEFLKAIKQRRDEVGYLPIILMSGRSDMAFFFDSWDIHCFLRKPFDFDVLEAKVADAIDLIRKTRDAVFSADKNSKTALVITTNAFLRMKLCDFLALKEYVPVFAFTEVNALQLTATILPEFILIDYEKDTEKFDTEKIIKQLRDSSSTSPIPFALLWDTSIARRKLSSIADKQILSYYKAEDLFEKLEKFIDALKK